MLRRLRRGLAAWTAVSAAAVALSGCTSFSEYLHNGFKVGHDYRRPSAAVAPHWIDEADLRTDTEDLRAWWTVFNDPVLNDLIATAYRQNLTLRQAGFRVLQARAQLGIAVGEVFPQSQNAFGSYRRQAVAGNFFDQWSSSFNLAWELDFWGRFRRAVQSADAQLDSSVENYDAVLVTLLGDVATNYVQIRTFQERISLLRANVELQRGVLKVARDRLAAERVTELDVDQAESNLAQTEAQIPRLEIGLRQASDRLCILLGIPAVDLVKQIGAGPIPAVPPGMKVAIGMPADLLRRRPDVRRAERDAAAQAELIGIAEAEFYPFITISGSLGYQAAKLSQLFRPESFTGNIGPSFQWNILNYGRILNNVRLQDAAFQELVAVYQNTVLQADAEVEDGLVAFLRSQTSAALFDTSVRSAQRAVAIVIAQYERGGVDFNRFALIEQNLVQQQDFLAQEQGQIAVGLIQVYRALGGGWQIRLESAEAAPAVPGPPPMPVPPNAPNAPVAELPH
ncbi:MAG: efflux transporter outer membrane subunit [Pirellulales bacterium]